MKKSEKPDLMIGQLVSRNGKIYRVVSIMPVFNQFTKTGQHTYPVGWTVCYAPA